MQNSSAVLPTTTRNIHNSLVLAISEPTNSQAIHIIFYTTLTMVHFSSAVVFAAMALSITPTLAVPVVWPLQESSQLQSSKEESKLFTRSPAPFWTELAVAGAVGLGAHKLMHSKLFSRSNLEAKVANSPKEGALVPSSSYNRRDIKDDYLLARDIDEYE